MNAGLGTSRGVMAAWTAFSLGVVAFAGALVMASPRFGYAYDVAEMPVLALTGGLLAAGLVFCLVLPPLIRASLFADAQSLRFLTTLIVITGLAARLLLFTSEPILEDDYQRYLWDGAVTAAGNNPYAVAPQDARRLSEQSALGRLAGEAGVVIARINHPDLKTIYPPVAQGAFALANFVSPFSLASWRAVLLAFDLATLVLILLLLRETGRSPLWSTLYWWNPLVIKELFNSAHMDAVLFPFMLAALLFTIRKRNQLASASLAFAAGAKIWPILLLPLILRSLISQPRKFAAALLIVGGFGALWATPILLGSLDSGFGTAAYVANWQTNSAVFPALESGAVALLAVFGVSDVMGVPITRTIIAPTIIALALGGLALALSLKPLDSADDLIGRAGVLVAALVLLSPAQFPWYATWFAPFLAFRPWFGFLVLTATAPLYYTYYMSFYFAALGEPEAYKRYIVWIIWVPVWAALVLEAVRHQTGARTA
jgi:hypothetical protein